MVLFAFHIIYIFVECTLKRVANSLLRKEKCKIKKIIYQLQHRTYIYNSPLERGVDECLVRPKLLARKRQLIAVSMVC